MCPQGRKIYSAMRKANETVKKSQALAGFTRLLGEVREHALGKSTETSC